MVFTRTKFFQNAFEQMQCWDFYFRNSTSCSFIPARALDANIVWLETFPGDRLQESIPFKVKTNFYGKTNSVIIHLLTSGD